MIKLENLSKFYSNEGNVSLGLRNINVELKLNEIVAIVGESGSGKTTFLNVVSGVDSYENGEMYFNGTETSYYSKEDMEKYRKNNVGFIFQNYNLVESYTVLENVMIVLTLRGFSQKEAKARALDIIEKVGLLKRKRHRATKLSGGEKQRCVIARALASDTPILACDEPTGNLDSKTGAEIIKLIKEVAKDRLVLIVTHNYDELNDIATRKLRFFDGELVEDKVIKEVLDNDESNIVEKDYKLKMADKLLISLKNILFTPKRTFFIFSVFFVLLLFIGSLLDGVFNTDYLNNSYSNEKIENRIVFKGEIDKDKYKNYDCYFNDFITYYEIPNTFVCNGRNINCYTYIDYTERNEKTLVYGRYPQASNEICIPQYYDIYDNNIKDSTIKIGEDKEYKVVGIVEGHNSLVTKDNYDYINNLVINFNLKEIILDNCEFLVNGEVIDNNMVYFNEFLEKSQIQGPYSDANQFSYKVNGKINNIDLNDFELTSKNAFTEIDLNVDYALNIIDSTILTGSILYNSDQMAKDLINKLKDDGIYAYDIEKINNDLSLDAITGFITFFFSLVGFIFSSFALYYISYLILSFVVGSKKKDFIILRTLGIDKSSMKNIVLLENLIIMMSSYFIFLFTNFIVYTFANIKIIGFVVDFDFWPIISLLLVMVLLTILQTRRFNKKLFKLTINSSLKKGAE